MEHQIGRRTFLRNSALLGASAFLGRDAVSSFARSLSPAPPTDLAVVRGKELAAMTRSAVEMIGGMPKFVPRSATVGLLVNSRYDKPGTFVKPEITLAVMAMCLEAGAKEIWSIENVSGSYWRLSKASQEHEGMIRSMRGGQERVEAEIKGGIALKKAEIARSLLQCDAFIDIAIVKDHEGLRTTGTLKNLMGATSGSTNRFFHLGTNARGYYDDIPHLSQCIADVNLLRAPALCVMDATQFIVTNGPFGPGKLASPAKVIAGTDRVAVDAYGASLLGLNALDLVMLQKASQQGLGEIDVRKLAISEVDL